MWRCWRRWLRVGWTEFRTERQESFNETDEPKSLPSPIKEIRRRLIGHTPRHEAETHREKSEGQIDGKRDSGRPRTTVVNEVVKKTPDL